MNLSESHVRVLTALRGATVLQREPKTLTPDGHEKWFSLTELAGEGRFGNKLLSAGTLAGLDRSARGLYKLHLAARSTRFGLVRYSVTEEGLLALAAHEAREGTAEAAGAALDLEQAREDERLAELAYRAAQGRRAGAEARLRRLTAAQESRAAR